MPVSVLLVLLVAAPANALITLTEDRSRFDLHEFTAGQWLPDWEPVPGQDWPDGQRSIPNAGWSDQVFHWSSPVTNESDQSLWYLVIRNPTIDTLRIYTDVGSPDQYIQLSDYQAPGQRLFPGNHFVVPLDIPADSRQTLYITATSEDWQFYPMMLVNQTGYQMFSQQETLFIGAVTGLLLALFLFNLLQTLLKGHWSFVWVAVSAIAWSLQLWFWYGLGYMWLWPHSPWLQNQLWYLLVPITGVSVLGSVIAAVSGYLNTGQKSLLYSGAVGGFMILLVLQLVLPHSIFLLLNWVWYTTVALMVLWQLRHTQALWSLHITLLGYSALSATLFAYMAWSPTLETAVMASLVLVYLVLTALHSFVVYWQFHRHQQAEWQALRARTRAYEDVADEQQAEIDHYRSAAQLGHTWRSTFTRNIADRFDRIDGAVETLRQTVKADERQTALAKAHRASQEGLNYVEDLLNLERLVSREYDIEQDTFNLYSWLDQFNTWFEQESQSNQVFFRAEVLTTEMPLVTGPANTLRLILIRFLENALQFTESGFIKLGVDIEGQTRHRVNCRFEVRDSGHGLSEPLRQNIQTFWQQGTLNIDDSDQQTHQTLGSGLTIALFLLRQLGARFEVQSTPDAGTSMRFWLWLDRPQVKNKENPVEHWLVVDESSTLYDEARDQLHDGVDVHWVKNGRIALSALRDTQFDVILIGLNTPVVDGIEFTRQCRERADNNRFAWIIGTHDTENDTEVLHATQAGMNEVMIRPQADTELRAWFRQLIRRLYRDSD